MNSASENLLTDEMFLVDVQCGDSGDTYKTLSMSRTPTMLMSFAANKFTEAAARYFKNKFDLGTVDWRVVLLLARMPDITAVQASKTLGVDQATVSRCAQRLIKMDLISVGDLHANGRSRGLSLSPAGRRLHDEILEASLTRIKFLLKEFDPDEVKVFCKMLLRLTDSLEDLIALDNK